MEEKKVSKAQFIRELKKFKVRDWATYCSWADNLLHEVSIAKTKRYQKLTGNKLVHLGNPEEFRIMALLVWYSWPNARKRIALNDLTRFDIEEIHIMVAQGHLRRVLEERAEEELQKVLKREEKS